jgi:hypothetical protein
LIRCARRQGRGVVRDVQRVQLGELRAMLIRLRAAGRPVRRDRLRSSGEPEPERARYKAIRRDRLVRRPAGTASAIRSRQPGRASGFNASRAAHNRDPSPWSISERRLWMPLDVARRCHRCRPRAPGRDRAARGPRGTRTVNIVEPNRSSSRRECSSGRHSSGDGAGSVRVSRNGTDQPRSAGDGGRPLIGLDNGLALGANQGRHQRQSVGQAEPGQPSDYWPRALLRRQPFVCMRRFKLQSGGTPDRHDANS